MTPADAARILAVAAGYDRRTVGEVDAQAWARALDELEPRDCVEAIHAHYRDSSKWVMPADIREHISEAKRQKAIARKNAQQRLALEEARSKAQPAGQAHDACRAAFASVIATRIANCRLCDDDGNRIYPSGRVSRETCTHRPVKVPAS